GSATSASRNAADGSRALRLGDPCSGGQASNVRALGFIDWFAAIYIDAIDEPNRPVTTAREPCPITREAEEDYLCHRHRGGRGRSGGGGDLLRRHARAGGH